MNKIISLYLIVLFICSCSKEEPITKDPVLSSGFNKDQVISELSQVLSLALQDKNVREFIHSEIEKQFTLDYDISYELIKEKCIKSEKYGFIEFGNLLEKVALDNLINI